MSIQKWSAEKFGHFARVIKFGRIAGHTATLIILTAAITALISEFPEPRLSWGVEDVSVEAGIS